MGFLIGAFGKLMAGKRVRSLQVRMMSVQSQLRRATRDGADMEKYFTKLERDNKSQMSLFSSTAMANYQQTAYAEALSRCGITDVSTCQDKEKLNNFYQYMSAMSTETAAQQQKMQAMIQMQNSMMEAQIEAMKEAQLQPLKDLEEELQVEKDSLESQIQIAQADYEACKEMEKAGAKSMTPQYTGQA